VRDTLNLIHELAERGVGVRNRADPIRVDSSNPADPMAQLAVVLLALFGQVERTYTLERAAHARAVAAAKGRRVGLGHRRLGPTRLCHPPCAPSGTPLPRSSPRPVFPRTSLYRHLPPRAPRAGHRRRAFTPPQSAERQIGSRIGHLCGIFTEPGLRTPLGADAA
jgi:hypothetical protein